MRIIFDIWCFHPVFLYPRSKMRFISDIWCFHLISPHWEKYVFISFHIEWDMIVVTVFLSILNWMEFHLGQNWKENCHHDHIPFNVQGNGNIVFSVYTLTKNAWRGLWSLMLYLATFRPYNSIEGTAWVINVTLERTE